MKPRIILMLLLLGGGSATAFAHERVETVPSVDLTRYAGKWYEVGRLPHRFQKDCVGATAEYELRDDGDVGVLNTCFREDGTTRSIRGKASADDDESNAKLRVRFDGFWFKLFSWLIRADYWVIALDPDYRHAMVGTPNRDYLWILSREPTMEEATYDRLLNQAASQGFEVDRVIRTRVPESAAS